jgi:hypothetical protein
MLLFNLVLLCLNIFGFVRIFSEYQYILDYKRDERIMFEYAKKTKKELNDIVDNPDTCGF